MMFTRDDVQRLIHDVGELKARRHAAWMERPMVAVVPYPKPEPGAPPAKAVVDPAAAESADAAVDAAAQVMFERDSAPVEWEVTKFGLRAELHDPVTGTFILATDPPDTFMDAKAVDAALWEARKPVMDKLAADRKAADDAARAAQEQAAAQVAKPVAA
jgi:hypothetical protein